jgi:RimJ/RimL family protein N-acetyltransferase
MNWAFDKGGFEQFIGKALKDNVRSWRSLERLGYKFLKAKPDTILDQLTEWKVYVMTKADWVKSRKNVTPSSNRSIAGSSH